ncbi:MAG: hypothetical protein HY704_03225 [Gemmatimonadetes bacterium]|nr:hypothetical protein [Gemmatimonadota bacterium]
MKAERARVLLEGLITGFIGYVVVALFYAVWNVLAGRSVFYTAALLGAKLVQGGPEATPVAVTPPAVIAYNGIHLFVFLALGFVAAWLLFEAERYPRFWYPVFFLFIAGFIYSVAAVLVFAAPLAESSFWWSVAGANALAALAMGAYLRHAHPRLWRELREHGDPEAEAAAPHPRGGAGGRR